MKNLITIIITLHTSLFTVHEVTAQWGCTCLPEGIVFTTQQQIDSFPLSHPGCMKILGNVTIQGDDITSLDSLLVLNSIEANLKIYNCETLTSLAGLEGLTSIGEYLEIVDNHALSSLLGLEGLSSIGGNLEIDGNPYLTSLMGLEGLSSIGGNLEVGHNHSLASLTGLEGLNSIDGSLEVALNDSLASLTGLEGLTSLGENLWISHNYYLTSLTGLDNLVSIGGSLWMSHNDTLSSLIGLENLTNIMGDLLIGDNYNGSPSLTSLTGLEGLTTIGGNLSIQGNYILTSLSGLENLASIGGNLWISQSAALANLQGLENLDSIGGNILFAFNHGLTSLAGLDGLTSIGGDLRIRANYNLCTCEIDAICAYLKDPSGSVQIYHNAEGCSSMIDVAVSCGSPLPCLENATYYFYSQFDVDHFPAVFPGCSDITGTLYICGNDITNLDSLSMITSISGYLWIEDNDALTSLTGLGNLASIGGKLEIISNDALTSLTGLENLTSVGCLYIRGNNSLTSLEGIDNLKVDYLEIYYNASLSTCHVQSICDYLAGPNGYVEIWGNAPGCNSREEVEEACLVGVGQLDSWTAGQLPVIVYPNPFDEIVDLEFEIRNPSPTRIQVFNAIGGKVADLYEGFLPAGKHMISWDTDDWPSGMYFCKVQMGQEVSALKILKQ